MYDKVVDKINIYAIGSTMYNRVVGNRQYYVWQSSRFTKAPAPIYSGRTTAPIYITRTTAHNILGERLAFFSTEVINIPPERL